MPEKISIEEYLDKRSLTAHDGVVYKAAKMPRSFDPATRSAVFTMTDESTDSYGDTVRAKGADLTRFESNPICLLNHNSGLVLGSWSDLQQKPKRIEGRATLAVEGTAPHVDMAFNLLSQGILRAASIGFMPTKLDMKLDDKGNPTWSYDILEWELYECSIVSVPANPAALAKSIKEGNMLARDFLDEVLDTYTKTAAGVIVPRAELEAAHRDATGDRTTILSAKIEDGAIDYIRLEKIAERMEKAAGSKMLVIDKVLSPEDIEKMKAAMAEHRGVLELASDPVEPLRKELELNVEGFLKDFQPKVEEIDEPERKSALTKLMDGIRSLFKAAPETEKKDPVIEATKADPEVQKALQAQFDEIAARHAA